MKKKWLLIIGGLLFVFIIIGSSGSSPETQNGNSQQNNEIVSRLSLEERQGIYREVVLAEDKGQKEASEQYPTDAEYLNGSGLYKDTEKMAEQISNNTKLAQELQDKYKSEVLEKYNITKEEFDSISIEAIENEWDMPEIE